ncbi:MAG: hypothetical protein LBI84_04600 [Propionibacteriaceae bacterium]|jgi:hypothetical protein|nr:hypothetical protein [Propionibacteriaceae bacterium]
MSADNLPLARPRRRRRPFIVAAVAVALLAGGAGLAYAIGHPSGEAAPERETRTAVVERTSLAAGFTLSGSLGYGTPTELGGGGGVVTKLPEAGQILKAGDVIMEIEGAPVFLLQGDLPLWREIGPGTVGIDVAALRSGLNGLGLDAGAGQVYDAALSAAIAGLYARAGYAEAAVSSTVSAAREAAREQLEDAKAALASAQQNHAAAAAVSPSQSQVVAAANTVRAAQRALEEARGGDCSALGLPVCDAGAISLAEDQLALAVAQQDELYKPPDLTAENQAVTQAQAAQTKAQQALNQALLNVVGPNSVLMVPEPQIRVDAVKAKLGLPATSAVATWTQIKLFAYAQLTEAQRRLIATGTLARLALPDGTELSGKVGDVTEPSEDPLTLQLTPSTVRIDIDDQAALAGLGPSSVMIAFIQDEAENTLVVPVTALMVLAEGGYCVERPDGSIVAVDLGLVADTRAQIFTDKLTEGDLVIVP